GGGGWVTTSYRAALAAVEAIAAALLARGAQPTRPVMILSDNSVAGARVSLAAMHVGVPVAPVSPAYAMQRGSFRRLSEVTRQLGPGFVFADDTARYAPAIAAVQAAAGAPVAVLDTLAEALAAKRGGHADVAAAFARLTPDTIAKILFTSGSTGTPKGVVNTHRMLTANQESLAACWPFLAATPPVIVDWLPWSHTFGSNHNFHLVLRNGGSLYLDHGRPAPGLIDTTIANLADVSPTIWFNVPRGFDQAVAVLEADPAIAARVFARLDVVFYAAAALGPATRARLERVAARAGRDVFFTSAWGSTETSPLATSAHFETPTTGNLGLPVPGVALKLAPVDDRLELRVRGANVTPGAWQPGGAVAPIALDGDGFLPTGDAGRLVDAARPEAGIVFAGRLGENFKLSSGTWVNVAQVRLAVIEACAPLVLEVVIAGHDREALGALVFPSAAGHALARDELRARLVALLAAYNEAHPQTSERIPRAIVVDEPLSLDDGETTDKAYTNQRRVLERRAATVTALFTEPAPPDVWQCA
ncbi:MAG TPA: AMP-binding protein, partial [Kofleriaceae bacterium]|nr:AMP-binding protein [Kofleriaceae bacterium]